MTRGFITIATGKKQYYKIAANLVKSYRYFSKFPLPFTIIAEEQNEYTELFDDVIITSDSQHSFMDKFLLFKLSPYDEAIFIDADSLCYGDLNVFFDLFEDATDFSAIGAMYPRDKKGGAWYDIDGVWKYSDILPYKSRVHAGVMFLRKSEATNKMYSDCLEIINNYDKFYFHSYPNSKDEATLGVAMPLNNMKTIKEPSNIFAYYPCLEYVNADILHGNLSYKPYGKTVSNNGVLFHYGTYETYRPVYKFNIKCLELLLRKNGKSLNIFEKLMYEKKIWYWFIIVLYKILRPIRFIKRVINKINKLFHQHKDI